LIDGRSGYASRSRVMLVVIGGPFFYFLLHNHFINKKKFFLSPAMNRDQVLQTRPSRHPPIPHRDELDGHKGGVKGPLLMKHKKKGKICLVIYIAGERFCFNL
jgi:hypothetical protein